MCAKFIGNKEIRLFLLRALRTLNKPDRSLLDASDLLIAIQLIGNDEAASLHNIRQLINNYTNKLVIQDADCAKVITSHYLQGHRNKEIARDEQLTLEQVKHRLRRGIDQMAQFATEDENRLRQKEIAELRLKLPTTFHHLFFGREDQSQQLQQHILSNEQRDWFLQVFGLGGVGKTSLVIDAISKALESRRFNKVVWINCDEINYAPLSDNDDLLSDNILEQLGALYSQVGAGGSKQAYVYQLLQSQPTLMVIDNFENCDSSELVLEELYKLANPLKIVLISRHTLHSQRQRNITRITLPELDQSAAHSLIYDCIRSIASQPEFNVEPEILNLIYRQVGGNPTAIKLIVSLATHIGLPTALRKLASLNHHDIKAMYIDIFVRPWQSLSQDAQKLLLMLAKEDSAISFEQLRDNEDLARIAISDSLVNLAQQSLVEIHGTMLQPLYVCNRLTKTFCNSSLI